MANQQQTAFANRIRSLEDEIAQLKDWEAESERYSLTEISRGVFAYVSREGSMDEEGGAMGAVQQPVHCLCTPCFQARQKSILHAKSQGLSTDQLMCPTCKSEFYVLAGWATYPYRRPPAR